MEFFSTTPSGRPIRIHWQTLLGFSVMQMALSWVRQHKQNFKLVLTIVQIFLVAIMLNWVAAHRPENFGNDMILTQYHGAPIDCTNEQDCWFQGPSYYLLRDLWFHWRGEMYICDITLAAISGLVAIAEPIWVRELLTWAIVDFVLGGLWVTAFVFLQVTNAKRFTIHLICVPPASLLLYNPDGKDVSSDYSYACDDNIRIAYVAAILTALAWFITCGIRLNYLRKNWKSG